MLEATFNRSQLRFVWNDIHGRLGATPDWDEFAKIMAAYGEKRRKYHGIRHLVHGFDVIRILLKEIPLTMREGAILMLAFFYHDIVYVVGNKNNEANSVKVAIPYAMKIMRDDECLRMGNLIIGTADHQTFSSTDPLWDIMNDADLAILSARPDIYKKYSKKVWQEYGAIVKRPQFAAGRASFLKEFNKNPIFRTHYMMRKEAAAKQNIISEILDLSKETDILA
jgi:predicted metal-dependent HD superfamily phosphohydrolase